MASGRCAVKSKTEFLNKSRENINEIGDESYHDFGYTQASSVSIFKHIRSIKLIDRLLRYDLAKFAPKRSLYRQIVGIPMGTNCAPLVADLFLYCYERDFMDYLNHDNQANVIEAFLYNLF